MVLKDAVDSAQENLFYELMNLRAFKDNLRASSKMSWVLRDWEMVRDNIVTKLARLDASVDRSLAEVDKTISKKIENDGLESDLESFNSTNLRVVTGVITENLLEQKRELDKIWSLVSLDVQWYDKQTSLEIIGPRDNLEDLETEIRNSVRANEARGKFSIIYLVKSDDETPLVVIFKHDNYTILDTTEPEWTFNTRIDWDGEEKTVSKILEQTSKNLREFKSAQNALIIAISGEEFVSREAKMTSRRYRRWSGKRQRPQEPRTSEDE